MDAKGFELLMSAKILGEGGGMPMDAKGFERLMAAKILGKGSDGKIKELEGVPPLTFTANGQPLLDYRIYGNTVQTGTPTPENPITPEGVGERTENLFDGEMEPGYYDNDGEKQSNPNWIRCKNLINADSNTTYHVIIDAPEGTSGSVVFARCYDASGEYIGTTRQTVIQYYKEYAFTTLNDTKFISFYVSIPYINAKIAFYQTTISGKAYIPYGYKLPLTSAGQDVDVYLGEVQTTRRIKKVVFDGTESWAKNSGSIPTDYTYYLSNIGNTIDRYSLICDRLPVVSAMKSNAAGIQFYSNKSTLLVNFTSDIMDAQTSGNTVIGLKEYLAAQYANGTPVTVWYVLAEPETGIVNEPMMKIGDYADTVSMEQAGVSIPTNKGSTTLDVDTIIKPSNVYIKYRS